MQLFRKHLRRDGDRSTHSSFTCPSILHSYLSHHKAHLKIYLHSQPWQSLLCPRNERRRYHTRAARQRSKPKQRERDATAKSRQDISSVNTLPGTSDIPTKKAKVKRAGGLVTSNPSRRRRGSKASDESYIIDDDSLLDLVVYLMTNFPRDIRWSTLADEDGEVDVSTGSRQNWFHIFPVYLKSGLYAAPLAGWSSLNLGYTKMRWDELCTLVCALVNCKHMLKIEWTTLKQKGWGLIHHVYVSSDGKNKNKHANPTAQRILSILFIHMLFVSICFDLFYLLHCYCWIIAAFLLIIILDLLNYCCAIAVCWNL